MIAIILPALLAAASLPAADMAALDAQVAEVFKPYGADLDDKAPWERPIFSKDVNALVAHWEKVQPDDGPDDLNDGDWLCQCQDWDAKAFKLTIGDHTVLSEDSVQVDVKIDLGFQDDSGSRGAKLIFRKEGADWKIDDLFADESFPKGLKQALRETIVSDEALKAGKRK